MNHTKVRTIALDYLGIKNSKIKYQLSLEQLHNETIVRDQGKETSLGAVAINTGEFTGRSPNDRFIVKDIVTKNEVWWSDINLPFDPQKFENLYEKVVKYLSNKEVFVRDAMVCADENYKVKIRVVNEYPWSNMFAFNMFLRPTEDELTNFTPEWTIVNAPGFMAVPLEDGTRQHNFSILNFTKKIALIGGTGYTGEMKKGIFSALNFILPVYKNTLPMHCSANVGKAGDTAIFFGLSGTGKTTLSTDSNRSLIGDDEHGWSKGSVFNIEGGCYAKTIDLSQKNEPVIWDAIRTGAIIENVVLDEQRHADYCDTKLTENGRCCYPLEHVQKRSSSNAGGEPGCVIFLTCDVFGVLPPVSILSKEAAAFHFLSGYTARVGSTEVGAEAGINPTFSTCFGAPFMPRPAGDYAELLIKRIEDFGSQVYLINTGWAGGSGAPGGSGARFPIPVTRAVVKAAQEGSLIGTETRHIDNLNLYYPTHIPGVDPQYTNPKAGWKNDGAYEEQAHQLATLFTENIKKFDVSDAIIAAGPQPL